MGEKLKVETKEEGEGTAFSLFNYRLQTDVEKCLFIDSTESMPGSSFCPATAQAIATSLEHELSNIAKQDQQQRSIAKADHG